MKNVRIKEKKLCYFNKLYVNFSQINLKGWWKKQE